jgi:hypothetical protein
LPDGTERGAFPSREDVLLKTHPPLGPFASSALFPE